MCRVITIAYILESLPTNFPEHEAFAFDNMFQRAGMQSKVFTPHNRRDLANTFSEIEKHLGPLDRKAHVLPFFHLSMHGDERGIQIASGEIVLWHELRDMIRTVAENTGRLNKSGDALAHITMSSCKGGHGIQMMLLDDSKKPAMSLVGPEIEVSPKQTLRAYSAFYYAILMRSASVQVAVEFMNQYAGLGDVYRLHLFDMTLK